MEKKKKQLTQKLAESSQFESRSENENKDDLLDKDETVMSSIVDSDKQYRQNKSTKTSYNERVNFIASKGKSTPSKRSQSASRVRRSPSFAYDYSSVNTRGRSVDDSGLNTRSTYHTLHSEANVREEMYREYTFKPKVDPLPPQYNGSNLNDSIPFYDRVMRWKRDKETNLVRKQQLYSKSEDTDCTFHPTINSNSLKAVLVNRSQSESIDVVDRLYKASEMSYAQKMNFAEQELRRERQEEDRECTFRPILSNRDKFVNVKSRFDQPLKRSVDDISKPAMKECTFAPKVQ